MITVPHGDEDIYWRIVVRYQGSNVTGERTSSMYKVRERG
jgi:hypothetical protein